MQFQESEKIKKKHKIEANGVPSYLFIAKRRETFKNASGMQLRHLDSGGM